MNDFVDTNLKIFTWKLTKWQLDKNTYWWNDLAPIRSVKDIKWTIGHKKWHFEEHFEIFSRQVDGMASRQNGAKFLVDKTWLQSGKEKMWQVNKKECWQMES
jgi:hypothetical protein